MIPSSTANLSRLSPQFSESFSDLASNELRVYSSIYISMPRTLKRKTMECSLFYTRLVFVSTLLLILARRDLDVRECKWNNGRALEIPLFISIIFCPPISAILEIEMIGCK